MDYQIHKGIVKIIQEDIPERNCVGSIIFTNNETNDREEDKFQPGHFQRICFSLGKELCWYP